MEARSLATLWNEKLVAKKSGENGSLVKFAFSKAIYEPFQIKHSKRLQAASTYRSNGFGFWRLSTKTCLS